MSRIFLLCKEGAGLRTNASVNTFKGVFQFIQTCLCPNFTSLFPPFVHDESRSVGYKERGAAEASAGVEFIP